MIDFAAGVDLVQLLIQWESQMPLPPVTVNH
jgi:hypothetical protein